ncbi:MAG TPA: peptidoglycan DD-metalloendopeptidase family protein [Bauldia sp.]|nr:peptidoglycan DD-metalloendopeptidase family protein [Bauldia sp.]
MASDETSQSLSPARKKPALRIYIVHKKTIRELRVRPWLAATAVAFSLLFFAGYFAATGYLIFRDDLLAASLARQARQKQAYEDRIAALRADIDHLASRQLLNQEEFEARLESVAERQAALDARQAVLVDLGDAARNAGLVGRDDARSRDSAQATDDELTTGSVEPASPVDLRLADMEVSLEEMASEQVAFIEDIASDVADRSERIAAVLKEVGRDVPAPQEEEAMGGPFIPMPSDPDPETFREGVALVAAQIEHYDSLVETASGLPLMTPMKGATITSRFGMRRDPFRRRPAMHTGIDFRAPTGHSARATAAGKVIAAGYSRGYGYMVEIDHGDGLSTRFAHLSKILVKKGQTVARGDTVGRTGSTGRSTGPHLHYEIRVNGRAIDPMTFIRAGEKISPLL